MPLRSPYDREIVGFALPALGALAAEPLYVLCDTAIVGHLGTPQLAALAIAGTLPVPAVSLMGADGRTADLAVLYLRISSIGVTFTLITLAGQGYLRGISQMRRPLVIVVVANAVNVVLEVLFVYAFGWGLAGSAWGTVLAQAGMGTAFLIALLRAPAPDRRPSAPLMRPLLKTGGDIAVRTGAL